MIDGRALLRSVMARKGVKIGELYLKAGWSERQTFANWMQTNSMNLNKFAKVADALGCDVALVDRATGEIYR